MKKQVLLLLIQIFTIIQLFSQTFMYNSSNNSYHLDGLKYYTNTLNASQNGKYKVCWYLSDGTYDCIFQTVQPNGQGDEVTIPEPANPPAQSWALTTFSAVYDRDDKPKNKIAPGGSNTGTTPNLTTEYPILFMPLDPRKNDTIITALNIRPCDRSGSGTVDFTFNNNHVEIINIDNPFSTSAPTINTSGSDETYSFSYTGLTNTAESQNVFLTLGFKNPQANQTAFKIVNKSMDQTCMDSTITYALKPEGDPHDPNFITSQHKKICPFSCLRDDRITYDIVFQNTGVHFTDHVTVRLYLPDAFVKQPSDIEIMGYRRNSSGPVPAKFTNPRQVEWTLTGANLKRGKTLRGTNEKTKNFTENDTRDTFSFRVKLESSHPFLPCSVVPIKADIIFKGQGAISTNHYMLEVSCTDCKACSNEYDNLSGGLSLLPIKNSGQVLDMTAYGSPPSDQIIWYPFEGLSSFNTFNPIATPKKDVIYFASIVSPNSCHRRLFAVPVKALKKIESPNSNPDSN